MEIPGTENRLFVEAFPRFLRKTLQLKSERRRPLPMHCLLICPRPSDIGGSLAELGTFQCDLI